MARLTYERRHGWKGSLQNVVLAGQDVESYRHPDWAQPVDKGCYVHGVVTEVAPKRVVVKLGSQQVGADSRGLEVDAECGWRTAF